MEPGLQRDYPELILATPRVTKGRAHCLVAVGAFLFWREAFPLNPLRTPTRFPH